MKSLSLSLLLFIILILFVTVQGAESEKHVAHKHETEKHIAHKHETKKEHEKVVKTHAKIEKSHTKVEKAHKHKTHKQQKEHKPKATPKPIPGHDYVEPKKIDASKIHIVPVSENKAMKDEKKTENKTEDKQSGSSGKVTVVGLALVAAAAGGMSYRNKAKKQLNSPELFKYKFENNTIYDYTPKDSSLTYSFSPKDFHEDEARLNFYDDNSNASTMRNSGSLSTEVIFEDEAEGAKRLNVTLPTNRAYKVVLPWDARCVDEIQLNCGDLVCIKECYQDGYSLGRNLTTRFDGIFPTCCLDNIGSAINQEEVNKWQAVGMYSLPKRSIKPTKKAKRASRGISLLTMPDWSKKLESLKLDSPNIF